MPLQSIELRNFRSYQKASWSFSPHLNLIIGPNGAGKTNLLEAIYALANTKSWRGPDRCLAKTGQNQFELTGDIGNKILRLRYKAESSRSQKITLINKTKADSRTYLGQLKPVLFEPDSLKIINGAPEDRRRWLNQVLSTYSPDYLLGLMRYKRLLRQRNALLKTGHREAIKDQVFAWDVDLSKTAALLVSKRLSFVDYLNKNIAKNYQKLAHKSAVTSLHYLFKPEALADKKNYASALLEALSRNLETDIRYRFTTTGPHRDDVEFKFKDQPAAQVASRGETRTLVLAIKLVEYSWLKEADRATLPVLLFDDIFSELDQQRRSHTLSQLKQAQIFITTTDTKGLTAQLPRIRRTINLKVN